MAEIETLDDWNARMACCCQMPYCPQPSLQIRSVALDEMRLCGVLPTTPPGFGHPPDAVRWKHYQTLTQTTEIAHTENGNSESWSRNRVYTHSFNKLSEACDFGIETVITGDTAPGCPYTPVTIRSQDGVSFTETSTVGAVDGDPSHSWREANTWIYSNPIPDNLKYLRDQASYLFGKRKGFEGSNSSDWPSLAIEQEIQGKPVVIRWVKSELWWEVVADYEGSWFKVTWDILMEPVGWSDTIDDPSATPPSPLPPDWQHPQIPKPGRPSRTFIEKDRTVTWNGSGQIIGDKIVIEAPSTPGEIRFVNVRFECYRGPYGTKPQVSGEAIDESEL
jgi:hypothetical protein